MDDFSIVDHTDCFKPIITNSNFKILTHYQFEKPEVGNSSSRLVTLLTEIVACDHKRPPICLSIALDISSSMSGNNRIEKLKIVLLKLINLLEQQDQFALVTFHDTANTLLPLCHMTLLNKTKAIHHIQNLACQNTTNLALGLKMAIKSLGTIGSNVLDPKMVLVSDGLSHDGLLDHHLLLDYSHNLISKFNSRIKINTIGFDKVSEIDILSSIAQQTGGNYFCCQAETSHSRLLDTFLEDVGLIEYLVAKNLSLTLEGQPGLQYDDENIGDPIYISINDLLIGNSETVLTTIRINNDDLKRPIQVKLDYQDARDWSPEVDNVSEDQRIYQFLDKTLHFNIESDTKKGENQLVLIGQYQNRVIKLCHECLGKNFNKLKVNNLEHSIRPFLGSNDVSVGKLAECLLKELFTIRQKYKHNLFYSELRLEIPPNIPASKNPTPIKRQLTKLSNFNLSGHPEALDHPHLH